ncbi:hypothetical protein IE077_002231 [Cardiosporidium cionae]|uniref:Uncharacterized protein n=1 Tax=Cardiosporidium cionae TaxID=476202 RepID=A0ABQ7JG02_9APIC|nr:hypothetical protein IE077_002231 [Cardiosporidium cionae]|eukprot:KAF8822896.1 hypothetical protein IE077_002231 [Cardiosporidium cionae]
MCRTAVITHNDFKNTVCDSRQPMSLSRLSFPQVDEGGSDEAALATLSDNCPATQHQGNAVPAAANIHGAGSSTFSPTMSTAAQLRDLNALVSKQLGFSNSISSPLQLSRHFMRAGSIPTQTEGVIPHQAMQQDIQPASNFEMQRMQIFLLTEMYKLRQDLLTAQSISNHRPLAPIIIQNRTELAAQVSNDIVAPQPTEEATLIPKWSRVNRYILLFLCGFGCYMMREHWRHTWRMARLQRRVDTNLLLRSIQMLEQAFGIRRSS